MQSLWMLFAAFAFSIMGVCVKLASDLYSTSEMVMYRGAVGVLLLLVLIGMRGGDLRTRFVWAHVWRGVVGVTSLWLWFYAIGKLPLSTAITLNYMAPIWMAAILLIAGLWYRRDGFEWGLTLAILMSFAGVTLLLQPAFHAEQWFAGLVGLSSGLMSALAYLQVRKLGQMGEPEYRVVFYFSLAGVVAGALGAIVDARFSGDAVIWHAHTPRGAILLLCMGVSAVVAQMAMTRAYRLGKTLVTANLQYTGIIFASLWGILIWNDAPTWMGWAGMAIIFVSGMAATYYNARNVAKLASANAGTGGNALADQANQANDPIVTKA